MSVMMYRDEDEEDFYPDVKEYEEEPCLEEDDEVDDKEEDDDPMPKGCLFVPALITFIIGAGLLVACS